MVSLARRIFHFYACKPFQHPNVDVQSRCSWLGRNSVGSGEICDRRRMREARPPNPTAFCKIVTKCTFQEGRNRWISYQIIGQKSSYNSGVLLIRYMCLCIPITRSSRSCAHHWLPASVPPTLERELELSPSSGSVLHPSLPQRIGSVGRGGVRASGYRQGTSCFKNAR